VVRAEPVARGERAGPHREISVGVVLENLATTREQQLDLEARRGAVADRELGRAEVGLVAFLGLLGGDRHPAEVEADGEAMRHHVATAAARIGGDRRGRLRFVVRLRRDLAGCLRVRGGGCEERGDHE
jgi:hypothetical protein